MAAVMFMLPLAMGNATGVLVGQAIGARNFVRARATGITGIALAFGLAGLSGTVLVTFANNVAGFYSLDGSVRTVAATLLVLVAAYHVFDATQVVTVNVLRGYKRAMVPLLINVMGLWGVGLLGGYTLGLTDTISLSALGIATPIGVPGFWAAAIIGMFASAAGIALYFFTVSATPRMRRA